METLSILVVRLGAMGDILHALPAAVTLKQAWPGVHLTWAVHPQWRALLEDGGVADDLILVEHSGIAALTRTWTALRRKTFAFAVDLQGLIKSSLVAGFARSARTYGFDRTQARERLASLLYTEPVHTDSLHVVDRNLEIAGAAGALTRLYEFPLPQGVAEGELPRDPFVIASPFAGWGSKQWPFRHFATLARLLRERLGLTLVVNGAPSQQEHLASVAGAHPHVSSISGLIHATRQAVAVVGVDSGPLHLAAALGKPGVAIFGPTDPGRNGPYSDRIVVLRSQDARTSYARGSETHPAMEAVAPEQVLEALMASLTADRKNAKGN